MPEGNAANANGDAGGDGEMREVTLRIDGDEGRAGAGDDQIISDRGQRARQEDRVRRAEEICIEHDLLARGYAGQRLAQRAIAGIVCAGDDLRRERVERPRENGQREKSREQANPLSKEGH